MLKENERQGLDIDTFRYHTGKFKLSGDGATIVGGGSIVGS